MHNETKDTEVQALKLEEFTLLNVIASLAVRYKKGLLNWSKGKFDKSDISLL